MKITVTGSLGHISKEIVTNLLQAGNHINVVTSSASRKEEIEQLGAHAFVGNVEDAAFIQDAFNGVDAVYLMIPPKWGVTDWLGYQKTVADNYVTAIAANNINYVVVLSSVGAHMGTGAGPIDGLSYFEKALTKLSDVNVLNLRPSYFFYNLHQQAGMIKQAGIMGSNINEDHTMVLTHTSDIAEVAIAALLNLDFKGQTVKYIASDERKLSEIASVLSTAVNKPGTPWIEFSDEQSLQGMLQAGLNNEMANGYVAMGKAMRNKEMEADYWNNRPEKLGKVKLEDFAKEFAAGFNGAN